MEYDKRVKLQRRELPTALPIRFPNIVEQRGLMVSMRDGVRLATDVYRPAGEDGRVAPEPLPAVLIRLPYGKDEAHPAMPAHGKYWARRGYVCVIQDVRGKFQSEGEWFPVIHEADDGFDTIDWVATQPWCDGQVAATGGSYLAHCAAASRFHSALRCMALGSTGIDLYCPLFEGGAFCIKTAGLRICNQGNRGQVNWLSADTRRLALRDLARAAGRPSHLCDLAFAYPENNEIWVRFDFADLWTKLDIPVFHWTGWYDNCLRGSLEGWQGIQERNIYKTVRQNQWLTISPADHELTTETTGEAGHLSLDAQGVSNDRICLFFDHWLRREESDDFAQTPRVRAYIVGGGRWREGSAWPLPGTRFTKYYLRSSKRSISEGAGGTQRANGPCMGLLSPELPGAETPHSFTCGPADPVGPWVGKDERAAAATLTDRRRVVPRPNVLSYETAPLAAPLEIVGPVSATLHVTTSARENDFTVTLVDTWPDGHAQVVQEGVRCLDICDNAGEQAGPPPAPDEVYQLRIDLAASGYEFAVGHRVGVEVSSGAFDRWDRKQDAGDALGEEAELPVAQRTVYHDSLRPSHIVLPLAPKADP